MGEYLNQIPETVQEHLRDIVKISGLDNSDESLERMAEAWIEKKNAFEKEIDSAGMDEVDYLEKDDNRGALVMTYSGSLVNIGPVVGEKRKTSYTSIGLRKDVPDAAEEDASSLSSDVLIDEEVQFEKGPVRKTSAVYKIAVYNDSLEADDQEKVLTRATLALTKDFIDINKTCISNA
ncbi:MAG TPA: hypothetical protein PK926_06115 [Spirochaetota bacterium]|nr:hypothetical protein [Spirochaetota bacterium]HPI89063.1 hypothetical protein [Spirochaetota bacterium]HPR48726.1 hypothetical protein [Spirochaetota bacterium]